MSIIDHVTRWLSMPRALTDPASLGERGFRAALAEEEHRDQRADQRRELHLANAAVYEWAANLVNFGGPCEGLIEAALLLHVAMAKWRDRGLPAPCWRTTPGGRLGQAAWLFAQSLVSDHWPAVEIESAWLDLLGAVDCYARHLAEIETGARLVEERE